MGHITYTQCRLERENTFQTAYIPSKFARSGQILRIKGENGWRVAFVGATVDAPPNVRKMIKAHRDNTGDSEKK